MKPTATGDNKQPVLTHQEIRMVLALRQIRQRAGRRPWMVIVRGTDGLVLVHEAAAPVKVVDNGEPIRSLTKLKQNSIF